MRSGFASTDAYGDARSSVVRDVRSLVHHSPKRRHKAGTSVHHSLKLPATARTGSHSDHDQQDASHQGAHRSERNGKQKADHISKYIHAIRSLSLKMRDRRLIPGGYIKQTSKKYAADQQRYRGVSVVFVFGATQRSNDSTCYEYAREHVCESPTNGVLLRAEEPCR